MVTKNIENMNKIRKIRKKCDIISIETWGRSNTRLHFLGEFRPPPPSHAQLRHMDNAPPLLICRRKFPVLLEGSNFARKRHFEEKIIILN